MDLSGLIFVALAVAWAVYLIPKALRHHEDVARARTVDSFSEQMRVVARREPVSAKAARLVVSSTRSMAGRTTTSGTAVVESDAPAPDQAALPSERRGSTAMTTGGPAAEPVDPPSDQLSNLPTAHADSRPVGGSTRAGARRAAQRRRRVLLVLLIILAGTAGVAALGRVPWVAAAVPAAVVVAWLVLCRVMVKGERARAGRRTPASVADDSFDRTPVEDAMTDQEPAADEAEGQVAEESAEPVMQVGTGRTGLWDPLPMTLPTYVSKPKATKRTVRTIDLDDSDVWTSGRTEVDAALAREADAERPPVAPEKPGNGRRAVGS